MKRSSGSRKRRAPALVLSILVAAAGGAVIPAWLRPGFVECPGIAEPASWVPLYSPSEGLVEQGVLTDGRRFDTGDLVLLLDEDWPRWNLDRIEKECARLSAEASYQELRLELFRRHRDLEAAERHRVMEDDRRLEASSSVSRSERIRSEYLYSSFLAASKREEADMARALDRSRTELVLLDSERELWSRRLEDCRLRAPISGTFYSAETLFSGLDEALLPPRRAGQGAGVRAPSRLYSSG